MTRRMLRGLLLATTLLVSLAAWAQDDPCSGYFEEKIRNSDNPRGVFAMLYHQPAETSCILGSSAGIWCARGDEFGRWSTPPD